MNNLKVKKVCNTFCYSGGFSIFALQANAELVHSVDSSQGAMDLTDQNVKLNFQLCKERFCIMVSIYRRMFYINVTDSAQKK